MNKIRKEIKKELINNSDSDIDAVMVIIELYLEEAFDAGRDETRRGCDWEYTYDSMEDWYKEMEAIYYE